MGYSYVYAPLSGNVEQRNDDFHAPCTDGYPPAYSVLRPIDISAGAGIGIYLYVSYPSIRSLYIEITTAPPFQCCDLLDLQDDTLEMNVKRAAKVYLYGQPYRECPLGWVLFGHIGTGYYLPYYDPATGNIWQSYVGQIGSVPTSSNLGGCYGGGHVHMECDDWGSADYANYASSMTRAATAVYQWVNNCP